MQKQRHLFRVRVRENEHRPTPPRVLLHIPIPNGMVFITDEKIDERDDTWCGDKHKHALWSVVIITDWAASGSGPSRPAASATISNAALHTTWASYRVKRKTAITYAPFCAHHQDARDGELQEVRAAAGIEHEPELEPCPRPVLPVRLRAPGEERQGEEAHPERYGDSERRPEKAQAGVVHEIYVESQIDRRDGSEDVSRRAHDPWARAVASVAGRALNAAADALVPELIVSDTRTLTLEILLEALEANVPWRPYDHDAQEGLYVMGETCFLAQ